MKCFIFIATFLLSLFFSFRVFALDVPVLPDRSYSYPSIDFTFRVNEDSTIDVDEKETFNFKGEYHEGWRSLLLDKVDDITDITVTDMFNDTPLIKAEKELDKLNPDSWGKYAVISENGVKNVIWYYNEKDTSHSWLIHYKLHGAIGFFDDHDELYWNLFTDFSEPIDHVTATVVLPKDTSDKSFAVYRGNADLLVNKEKKDPRTFYFSADVVAPDEDVTIAPGWDKGIVNHNTYIKYMLGFYWKFIFGVILVLASILFVLVRWYVLERLPMKRMTIIPQYEPPENLRPALAEVVMREHITKRAWPATIIDLACRGYITIEENNPSFSVRLKAFSIDNFFTNFLTKLLYGTIIIGVSLLFVSLIIGDFYISLIFCAIVFLFMYIGSGKKKHYILRKTKKTRDGLAEYEKKYYNALFERSDEFSTLKMVNSRTKQLRLHKAVEAMTKELYEDAHIKIKAFNIAPRDPYIILFFAFVLFFLIFFISAFVQFNSLITAILLSLVILFSIRYNAVLNTEGRILKADWLGFKMYMQTAERYRMQNLTPDMFEKYLPYAMIFGIEKKWARAFRSMNIAQPSWYITGNGANNASGVSNASFSPSGFSSSFSASFASSFSSSGGGGSGGGGGAGGGGGGGGGGAS